MQDFWLLFSCQSGSSQNSPLMWDHCHRHILCFQNSSIQIG